MKVWLDDKRPMPESYDIHVLTAQDAINQIETGNVTVISLDHDLGDESKVGNGYMVAKHIEERAYYGCIKPIKWSIHSQNAVGVAKMRVALENADSFWQRHREANTICRHGTVEHDKGGIVFLFCDSPEGGKEHRHYKYDLCLFSEEEQKMIVKGACYAFIVMEVDITSMTRKPKPFLKRMKYTKADKERIEQETNELLSFLEQLPRKAP